ncbi:hypothetical protein Tco_1368782 [Tanacetum coccineum]
MIFNIPLLIIPARYLGVLQICVQSQGEVMSHVFCITLVVPTTKTTLLPTLFRLTQTDSESRGGYFGGVERGAVDGGSSFSLSSPTSSSYVRIDGGRFPCQTDEHVIPRLIGTKTTNDHYPPFDSPTADSRNVATLVEILTLNTCGRASLAVHLWLLQIPLFKCDWVNHKAGGVKHDPNLGYTLVDLNSLGHKDDPFILASQARQVFYVKDQIDKKLSIVFRTPTKNYKDTYDEVDEEFSTVIHEHNDNILPRVNRRDLGNESQNDYYRTDCEEPI